MGKTSAKIVRKNGKPFIDKIDVQNQHDIVEWSIDAAEKTEFAITFQHGDPFMHVSSGQILQLKIDPRIPRGDNRVYPYNIKLMRTSEEVEGNSPPEMEIQ
jgi:hypothetical protein